MVMEMTKRRFCVKDLYLMDEAGVFCEDDRVELVDGEIIDMAPIGELSWFQRGCADSHLR